MHQKPKDSPQPPSRVLRSRMRRRFVLVGVESRWPEFVAAIAVVAGQTQLAGSLQLQPAWVLPGVAGALLVVSIGFYISPKKPGGLERMISIVFACVLVIANMGSLVALVRDVFTGSSLQPIDLLLSGIALWVVNVLVFAIVYWELDGGGPEARLEQREGFPDFVFPQQLDHGGLLAPADWRPSFGDYLYISLTTATAFSPTDTMPYTKRAKFSMGVQSVFSFAIAAVLIARAVNIAQG